MNTLTPQDRANAETQAAVWALAFEALGDDFGASVLAATYFQGWPHDRKPTNREDWLHDFTEAARPYFMVAGHSLPTHLRIGVGWSGHGRMTCEALGDGEDLAHAA